MLTRRKLLKTKAALLALPFASRIAVGSTGLLAGANVFYDERIRDCLAFADFAGKAGAAIRPIRDDISAAAWAALKNVMHEPGIIAGLTPEPMAFLFDAMARDAQQHQAFRGEHFYAGGRLVGHRITAPGDLAERVLPGTTDNWTGELIEHLIQFDAADIRAPDALVATTEDLPSRYDFKLLSWIFAPLPGA